jgi:DNA-binding transcriptional ArsR family regulator
MAERHNVPGTPERHNVPGTPERHNLPGTPERHNLPGTPERHNLPGTPERHNLPRMAERHNLPGTAQRAGRQRPGRPRKHHGLAPGMVATADRFAALADGTRRHLLEQLAAADRPVAELVTGLDISQAAVSQHLRILREAGLVTARKQGRHRYYQLRPSALEELRDWLDELEQFWRARLTALGDYLREAPG